MARSGAEGSAAVREVMVTDPGRRGLRDRLIKFGARVVRYAKHVTIQMDEVAVARQLFSVISERIRRTWVDRQERSGVRGNPKIVSDVCEAFRRRC